MDNIVAQNKKKSNTWPFIDGLLTGGLAGGALVGAEALKQSKIMNNPAKMDLLRQEADSFEKSNPEKASKLKNIIKLYENKSFNKAAIKKIGLITGILTFAASFIPVFLSNKAHPHRQSIEEMINNPEPITPAETAANAAATGFLGGLLHYIYQDWIANSDEKMKKLDNKIAEISKTNPQKAERLQKIQNLFKTGQHNWKSILLTGGIVAGAELLINLYLNSSDKNTSKKNENMYG